MGRGGRDKDTEGVPGAKRGAPEAPDFLEGSRAEKGLPGQKHLWSQTPLLAVHVGTEKAGLDVG